ncbi:glycosyltransferase [Xanthomarina sp. GH4-25]|uniref:glycosyltransferase n=1 Tax=Xanthomarina sp. GH4-25 TaxID=3349335 RepID=UPI003877DEE2
MKAELAIIIPYYKLTFFEDTLVSLANQTDKRFKVYIGDDASPESPDFLLEHFKGQFDFIYHRFHNNLGQDSLTKQWDRCIALAQDEPWLMILGDDDVLELTVVESFFKHHELFYNSSYVIRFATHVINEITKTTSSIFKQPELENAYTSFYRRIIGENRSTLSEYIFSKAKYNQFGFVNYPLAWHSDDRAWLDFSDGLPIYSINEATVSIRMSNLHISSKTDNLKQKHQAQLLFYNYLVNIKLDSFTKKQQKVILSKYEKLLFVNKGLPFKHFFNLILVYFRTLKVKALIHLKLRGLKHYFKK